MEIEHETTTHQLELALENGVDIVRRNGFYETTDFWSLGSYKPFRGKGCERRLSRYIPPTGFAATRFAQA
ncbi:MAG: hypothetical protein FGF48_00240 [Candidatus Brockarchaeota archaeon]|nr:hypothetical protein [Candidatus Brockarchaeota archaeon]